MRSPTDCALVVIDVQNDFCPGGALAVPDGDRVIAPINRLLAAASRGARPVFASRDWHPAASTHFVTGGGDWPVHCVADSAGAAFHPALRLPPDVAIVAKGTAPTADGYSVFDGRLTTGPSFDDALTTAGTRHLVMCGLATDYCVRASVLDACTRGYRVTVVDDAIAAVDRTPDDGRQAVDAMQAAGARLLATDASCALLG